MSKASEYLKKCNAVYHTTLNPNEFGCVRIHLVPPKKLKPAIPWVVILNGYSVIPLQSSWAILLKEFIEVLNKYNGKPLSEEDLKNITDDTLDNVSKIFPNTPKKAIASDLDNIISTLKDVALGIEPSSEIGYMTLSEYSKYMRAPHRMDIMLSAMTRNGKWCCNQKCIHCYAANMPMSETKEMTTEEVKRAIDSLREACVPAITFTGGEATTRDDLVLLVDYAKWFVTRLNTNGILLTKDLCKKLYDASLDSVQVTLYSANKDIHNKLVGGNHYDSTIEGIKNAIASGLDVSINTPLCSINRDYLETVKSISKLGVRYFSCSGLIPQGNALTDTSTASRLSKDEITKIVLDTLAFCKENKLELAFTSPGWIDNEVLKNNGLVVPSCGACLSNMAIAPDGSVIPCQSWLNGMSLGNILTDSFKSIWNSKKAKKIRKKASTLKEVCLLKEEA